MREVNWHKQISPSMFLSFTVVFLVNVCVFGVFGFGAVAEIKNRPTFMPITTSTQQPTTGPPSPGNSVLSTESDIPPRNRPTFTPITMPTQQPTTGPPSSLEIADNNSPGLTSQPKNRPTFTPITMPTQQPTTGPPVPTTSPTRVCLQWALGDAGETCCSACSRLTRVCKDGYFMGINSTGVFSAVVEKAVNIRSGTYVGSIYHFCKQLVVSDSVKFPSAVDAHSEHSTDASLSCGVPASVAATCEGPVDKSLRRFCPCVDYDCDSNTQ